MYRGRRYDSTASLAAEEASLSAARRSLSFALSPKGYEFAGSVAGFQQWRVAEGGLVQHMDTVDGSFRTRHCSSPSAGRGTLHIESAYLVLVTGMYSDPRLIIRQ